MGKVRDRVIGPGRTELATAMRSPPVVMALVLGQDRPEMPFAEDEHPVGDLCPGGKYEPFRVSVRAWTAGRDLHGLDASVGQHCVERVGELPGPVADQVPEVRCAIAQVHQQVADLLRGPRPVRVRRDAEDVHVARTHSAEARYWSLAARHVRGFADDDIATTTTAAEEARRARGHLEALETQLNELDKAAATELQLTVHNELRSITESAPGADFTAVQTEANQRLGITVEVWARRWGVHLSQLARDSAAELTAWPRRPGAAAFDDYLRTLLSDATQARTGTQRAATRNIINYASLWAPQIAQEAFRLHTGMSPVQAQISLDHLSRSAYTDLSGFTGVDQAIDVQRHLKQVRMAEVVPLLIQLGTLIWTTASEHQLASQERQRRDRLQADIEKAAKEMSQQILDDGWNAAVARFRGQLRERMPPAELLASVREHIERLTAAKTALDDLLKKA
jgi:hypothetical protein